MFLLLCLPCAYMSLAQAISQQQVDQPAILNPLGGTPFKQEKIADRAAAKAPLQWKGTTITYSSDGLSFAGTDQNGGHWSAVVSAGSVLTCEIWASTLYQGSRGDLIIMNSSHYEGSYGSDLTILSFDDQGRPFPWHSTGAFTTTKDGIAQIVKAQGEDYANIVVSKREGDKHDGYAYVHQLVSINPDGMSRVSGSKFAYQWPVITGNVKALSGSE